MKKTMLLLGVVAVTFGLAAAQEPLSPKNFPIAGKAGPGLEPFDDLIVGMMNRHGIPGAAFALAKDGKLVLAKGYGWADITGIKATPETMFLLASLSKPITAAAILKLIQEGKLRLDDLLLDLVPHIRPKGGRGDPRLGKVTIRQLLNHTGGWDRDKSGDPATWTPQYAQRFGLPTPLTTETFLAFIMSTRLDFEPGTQTHYSNIGYIFLGEVIEKVTGQSYEQYVRKNVLEPMGIKHARIQGGAKYLPQEATRYLAGTTTELPPLQSPMINAAAGWSASAVDMVRFLCALDGSRGQPFLKDKTFALMLEPPPAPLKANPDGTFHGIGWVITYKTKDAFGYSQDGQWHGARTYMKRTAKGVNFALLFNAGMQPDRADAQAIRDTVQHVRERIEKLERFPDIDLFKD